VCVSVCVLLQVCVVNVYVFFRVCMFSRVYICNLVYMFVYCKLLVGLRKENLNLNLILNLNARRVSTLEHIGEITKCVYKDCRLSKLGKLTVV